MMKGFSISSGGGSQGGGNKVRTLVLAGIVVVLGGFALVSKADRALGRATALVTVVKGLVGIEEAAPAPAPAVAAAPATPAPDSAADSTAAKPADSTVAQAGAPAPQQGRAGVPGAAAKAAATKAADAASARVNAQTVEEPAAPAAKAPVTAPATKPAAPAATPAAAPARAATNPAIEAAALIQREVFTYESEGRRDPFVSLMRTTDLRPALQDLRLTGIIFDHTGQRPVAIMRETSTNEQYRVTTGMTLGRMRVAEIRPKKVIFIIEEFGFSRRDSLVLADPTTKRIP
jgi:hypothetical protein